MRLIDERPALRLQPDHNWSVAHTLTSSVWRSLTEDSLCLSEVEEEYIGDCMDMTQGTFPDLQVAYIILKMCYRHALARQPNPSWVDLEKVSGDYAALYQW